MVRNVDARTLKAWLSDGSEIALLDVREYGRYGDGHLFFAVSLPYSRFELGLPALVPNLIEAMFTGFPGNSGEQVRITVMPPAIASGICGSWGQKLCSAQTCAVTGSVASFPSLWLGVPGAA